MRKPQNTLHFRAFMKFVRLMKGGAMKRLSLAALADDSSSPQTVACVSHSKNQNNVS